VSRMTGAETLAEVEHFLALNDHPSVIVTKLKRTPQAIIRMAYRAGNMRVCEAFHAELEFSHHNKVGGL
jgi:hypothetical protein